jgi:hypothetical protein
MSTPASDLDIKNKADGTAGAYARRGRQSTITKRERVELERLVDKAEKISLHNAGALVEYRRRRADKAERTGTGRKRRSGKESEAALLA